MNKNKVLSNAFSWLFVGLLLCFITSYVTTMSESIMNLVYGSLGGLSYFIYLIAEIVIAILFAVRIRKLSPTVAKILYLAYSVLTGLSLSGVLLVYTSASIAFVFLVTAVIFGAFAIIGKTTKVDMTKISVYLLIALLAIILLEIVNIFLANNTLNMAICVISIIIFCAYVAYDVQLALRDDFLTDTENKGIYIAFQLFIDFINLFLRLIRLFGKNRD